jgi:DNA-binding transcriptional MerR regulator
MSRAQVARAAQVTRATVKHYYDLGLLPRPLFTGPNMAYYGPACVERIRLVRELQSQRHLPLQVIARLLKTEGAERVERALRLTRAFRADLLETLAGEPGRPVEREDLLAIPGMDESVLSELETLGLVRALPGSKGGRYDSVSSKLAHAVAVMRAEGLTEQAGFRVGDLRLYRDRLASLVRAEVRLFNSRVLGRFDRATQERFMRAAMRGTDALVLAIRDRLLADVLQRVRSPREDPRRRKRR